VSIRAKLAAVCCIVVIACSSMMGFWYRNAMQMKNQYLQETSQSAMRDAYNAFSYLLTDTQYMCTLISLNQDNIIAPLEDIQRNEMEKEGVLNAGYLQNRRTIQEFISSMYGYKYYIVGIDILSEKGYRFSTGHIVQNYDQLLDMIGKADPEVLRRSMVMMSPLHVDGTWTSLSSDYVVPSVRAILDSRQQVIGYTVLYFDYSVIESMFSEYLPANSQFQVTNRYDKLIFSNCGDTLMQNSPHSGAYVYNTFNAQNVGWTFAMAIPSQVYTTEIQRTLRLTGTVMGALCLTACAICMIISHHITQEISGLRDAMHRVAAGDLGVQYARRGKDEIAVMGSTFNHMVKHLQELVEQVSAQERQKSQMQMQLLQAKINPHFISNTLSVVAWMAKVQHADNIIPLTTALSTLLRSVMRQSDSLIPLSAELEYVRSYLEIMSCSGNYDFTVEYDIGDDTVSLLIPRFILQPIVENAVVHGLPTSLAESGHLKITAVRQASFLRIEVENNGNGISPEQADRLLTVSHRDPGSFSSVGVPNVVQRLRLYAPEPCGLKYESREKQFTRAIFTLPIVEKKPETEAPHE
jgi:sensor histidine kinase YesM